VNIFSIAVHILLTRCMDKISTWILDILWWL